jgi:hypothetical protein
MKSKKPVIIDLAKDPDWRDRARGMQVVKTVPTVKLTPVKKEK